MRIRSLDELDDFLDEDLSRRKRELTTLKFMLTGRLRSHERKLLLRAAVCMLYAHWEGFIKRAATAYVSFVAVKGLRYRDLSPNFLALGLRRDIVQAGQSNNPASHIALTTKLFSGLCARAQIDWRNSIDTRSNLNSDTLHNIFSTLGLDDRGYLLERQRIDQKLVMKRNGIAHGELIEIDIDDYTELHDLVLKLAEQFRIDIGNAAATEDYRR